MLLSETVQYFPEIIILLENLSLSEKKGLIVHQKSLLPNENFWFTFEKYSNWNFKDRLRHAYGKSLFRLKACLD